MNTAVSRTYMFLDKWHGFLSQVESVRQ